MADGNYVHSGAIAVDPNIFSLGSNYWLPMWNSKVRAEDTGSDIIGYHIDIWMPSCKKAFDWGVRKVYIYR